MRADIAIYISGISFGSNGGGIVCTDKWVTSSMCPFVREVVDGLQQKISLSTVTRNEGILYVT